MCAETTSTLELRQQTLRSELKAWEHLFAEANGGRKAGKEDIKRDPEIAAKYKEYSKLRARSSDVSIGSEVSTPKRSRKRKSDIQEDIEYPVAKHPALIDPYDIPQHMSTTPRIIRTFIGPTPQRNGQVMGLFDGLTPSSARTATPSKTRSNINQMTPSRIGMDTPSHNPTRNILLIGLQNTPGSSVRRRCESANKTPSAQRQHALAGLTPSSNRLNVQGQLDLDQTPVFLKRVSDPSIFTTQTNELGTDIDYSPPANLRLPRKPIGRSLSQLVQSLRQNEDERLDEEMALMREIETGESMPPKNIAIPDSQSVSMLFGPDLEGDLANSPSIPKESEPRTVWKKKGQKRTTRRANIGVNRAKWRPEIEWQVGDDSEEESEEHIPDTQAADAQTAGQEESNRQDSAFEKAKGKEVAPNKDNAAPAKKKRMINPNAISHANFRSLKIKNKNSKGKKGGRFGRR